MSLVKEPEITQQEGAAQEGSAQNSEGPAMAEAPVSSAVANFRSGFFNDSNYGLLMALGEEPREYQKMMESLLEDLQPRAGLESQLVEQMGLTFWRMRRAQRMQDGLALRRIQDRLDVERLLASNRALQTFERLEPFERLKEVLARRGQVPTAAEIDEFVQSCKADSSEKTQALILLLRSLKDPRGNVEQKATLQKARAMLRELMEVFENLAWRCSRRVEQVGSPENLAALMAPDDQGSALAQKMEELSLRRLWRLTNALAKVRQGALDKKKDVKNSERSHYVYENKQHADKKPDRNSDI